MPHVLQLQVLPDDIDELGHASNLVYLRWVLEAAKAHSAAVGLGPEDYLARGQVFVVRRHEIEYFRAAMLGDALDVDTRVTQFLAATSERQTTIRRAADGTVLACARTRWAFVAHATGRPMRIPDDIQALLPAEAPDPVWLKLWKGATM
jgi:acyl-CoA thioester hydrolase